MGRGKISVPGIVFFFNENNLLAQAVRKECLYYSYKPEDSDSDKYEFFTQNLLPTDGTRQVYQNSLHGNI